jgi:hypothetical protein
MGYKAYCRVSGVLFALVALAHLLRIIAGLPLIVGTWAMPMYVSWGGLIVPAALAIWAFRQAGR